MIPLESFRKLPLNPTLTFISLCDRTSVTLLDFVFNLLDPFPGDDVAAVDGGEVDNVEGVVELLR